MQKVRIWGGEVMRYHSLWMYVMSGQGDGGVYGIEGELYGRSEYVGITSFWEGPLHQISLSALVL